MSDKEAAHEGTYAAELAEQEKDIVSRICHECLDEIFWDYSVSRTPPEGKVMYDGFLCDDCWYKRRFHH